MTVDAIAIMVVSMFFLWGVAVVSFIRSVRAQEKRDSIIVEQGSFESYSPRSMIELKAWIEKNSGSPHRQEAVHAYNESVRQTKRQRTSFYRWEDGAAEQLSEID